MHVLVVGSTGFLGSEICHRLRAAGHEVRGLVRANSDAERVAALRAAGVRTVQGDLKDPASLRAALDGVDAVVSTANTTRSRAEGDDLETVDDRGQGDLIRAASEADVDHFVYVSFSANLGGEDPFTRAKRDNERRLRESGVPWTVLRPSCFMEAWLSPPLGFDWPNARATLYGDGRAPLSWISLEDVAAWAVRALEAPELRDQVLELGGPEALSAREVVRIFEEESGRTFEVQHVPLEALRAREAAATDPLERSFAGLMVQVAQGDRIPMEETLSRLPMEMRTVRDYARACAAGTAAAPA